MHLNNLTPPYTIQGPALTYPTSTLHELFKKQALATPEAIALEFEDEKISYDELQKRINKTAQYLWDKGIRPNQIVALSLDRNPNLIISIFAILKCGASYVPIDTAYPNARKQFIVSDSGAAFFINELKTNFLNKEIKNITLTDDLELINNYPNKSLKNNTSSNSESIAYIMYTSGSTGKPKGVKVLHKGLINLIYSSGKNLKITSKDKFLSHTTISFDPMVMEIILPLLHGSCVVFIDDYLKKDGNAVLKKIIEAEITVINGTPSFWQILVDSGWQTPLNIKILCGGEALHNHLVHDLIPRCYELWNMYGPTETSVCCFMKKIDLNEHIITIGKPIANTYIYLLDANKNPVKQGEVGEIAIGGDGVSLGYLNRKELQETLFIPDIINPKINEKIYLSGDLGKLLPSGEIQCLGRKDHQVKIRGHRIELGEIETLLDSIAEIKRSAVVIVKEIGIEPRLAAYLQPKGVIRDTKSVTNVLKEVLPDFMIPSFFVWIDEFPMTSNEKIDKKNLPPIEYKRPESLPILKKPRNKTEKAIVEIWSELLSGIEIGIDDNFFEMGGTSLLTQKVSTLIKTRINLDVSVTKIYQYPTISALSGFLNINSDERIKNIKKRKENKSSGDIAVIGMACRLPGASTIDTLWDVLINNKETISFFTPDELDKTIPEALRNDLLYVSARGIIPTAKEFDASFFGINTKLAEAMDPQQRLFLEIAWEALEQSGHLPIHYKGSIGVYAGVNKNTYYINNVLPNKKLINAIGSIQVNTVNDKDYIASRTSYHLNLKGPAVSVHSACSTSLLAIAQAVQALRSGQCDVALAGGSSVTSPINSGHLYQEGSMLSPDGHCRSFDANGKGTVFSDGAGVVLLKSLEAAKRDGDVIHGIIKGIGINNDGGDKGSFTAPSTEGQAGAISKALLDAQMDPSEISYVETHGTATPVGDPIEMEGLQIAFGKRPLKGYCAIGSIKSNMGHLTAAAGVAGFIKTILALKHKKIPASLGYEKPNPFIDFENSPFYVNNTLSDWTCEGKRRAGISSFGVGGTNVHIITEAYETTPQVSGETKPLQIITWSAKSKNSLETYKTALGNFIKSSPNTNIADIACSLSATRDTFSKRSFILANGSENAFSQLLSDDTTLIKTSDLKVVPTNLAFLFPGQGAQYLQMGKALYEHEIIFREAVDTCSELLLEAFKFDIRHIIYPEHNTTEDEERLKDTQFTQPALFVVEYALSQLWMHWGIKPTYLCGHSVGEFVAAHLAGVFTLKDALVLVGIRGKLISKLPGGSMLSIRTTHENLTEILPKELSIAAVNSDQLCVVSGENTAIEHFAKVLENKNIYNKLLRTSHAFHSTMMDPILEAFEVEVRKVSLNVPRIPIISTVTGTYLSDAEATDPNYWTHHLRATVRFSDAMETALQLDDIVLLEVGPGSALTTLSKQKKRSQSASSIPSLTIPNEHESAYHTVLNALGQLWLKGIEPNWNAFYEGQSRQKIWLPAYAFDRKLCWVDPPVVAIPHENFNTSVDSIRNHSIQPQIDIITEPINNQQTQPRMDTTLQLDRKSIILEKISDIILNTSGMELLPSEHNHSFLELGLDSLVLTQMAITCKNEFDTSITFRQLNGEFSTPNLLATHLDKNLPPDRFAVPVISTAAPIMQTPIKNSTPTLSAPNQTSYEASNRNTNSAISLIGQQLQLLAKQIELLQGTNPVQLVAQQIVQQPVQHVAKSMPNASPETLSDDEIKEHKKPFGASPKIEKEATELNTTQETFLKALTASYNKKTAGSKSYTQKHRPHMSDPRVVSGFKPLTKELVYPLVIGKSSGNKLWDVDGNEYIDALNGFGSCLFGHQPDFIKEALHNQIELGYEVGPQHPLAGEISELLCELTQHDRAALCNTGSEAVLGAIRIARTVTGRSLIIAFSRSYHGIIDEALVRGSRMKKTFPAAAGIMPESVQNMLILDYGTEESLQIIRERAHELAAVLVEPVQSRRPEFQPVEFLKEVQNITKASHTALIFDEIITGFRMHPQGMQGIYGIKADIATYGKVIGGGLSIGAILGSSKYMDALDGGHWQFGDDSFPEVGVTYFAGTFVRHPLALASAKASLLHLKEQGPKLQDDLANMTEYLAHALNTLFKNNDLPIEINYYKSLWRLSFLEEIPYSELIFVLLREKGIHIWDGFPCFLTTAYKQEDLTKIIHCFAESIKKMTDAGIFKSQSKNESKEIHKSSHTLNTPPQEGARLAIDEFGNPAWYLKDENKEGEYLKIEL